jgi:cell division septation protein DedD
MIVNMTFIPIVFILLFVQTSAFIITLENITFPLLVTCNQEFCTLDELNETPLQNVNPTDIDPDVFSNSDNLLSNVQFTGVCQDNNDCPRLQVCENIGCTSPSLGCTSDSQCFDGDFCIHGACSNLVSCDQGCTGGTVCLDNFCLPPPSTGATTTITPTSTSTQTTTSTSTTVPTTTQTTTSTSTQTTTTTVAPTSTTTSTSKPTSTVTLPCSTSTVTPTSKSTPSYKTRYY